MNDYLMSINKFEKPVTVGGKDAIYLLLIRLLRLNPGSISLHPEMGVGIIEKWRYIDMDSLGQLEQNIQQQITDYLPMLQGVKVSVSRSKGDTKAIIIDITVSETLYKFKADAKEITLSDIG